MRIDFSHAEQLAKEYLDVLSRQPDGVSYSIIDTKMQETPDGWYFPYQSTDLMRAGDFDYSLVGNWPIFVSKDADNVEPRRPPI